MKYFYSQHKVLVILMGFILASFLIGLLAYRIFIFQITGVSPESGGTITDSTKTIQISFNKDLDEINQSKQIITNKDIIAGYHIEGGALYIQLKNLEINQDYQINLLNISAQDNSVINSYTYTFNYDYVPYDKLSSQEQADQVKKTDAGNLTDPVIKLLPASSDHYYINYSLYNYKDVKGKYEKLTIALLLTNAELDDTAKIRSYKKEAVSFLNSKGINVNDYIVEWAPSTAAGL